MLPRRFQGLWSNHDFLKLWTGETISLVGTQITVLAIPLAAALTLKATPMQMGILGLAQFIPWLVVGLFAGMWGDRLRRRPMMIVADLGRAVLLGCIPLAGVLGFLRIELLYVIGFFVGVLNVFFEVAYIAYLPTLVSRDQLVEGNGKLQVTASIAEITGPGIAGTLVQIVTAPITIIVDAVSFLISAVCLSWIRAPEPAPASTALTSTALSEIRDGLHLVVKHPLLRAFAGCATTANVFISAHMALYVLYLTRELGIQPATIGAMYSIAGVGSLLGALVAGRVARWMRLGRLIVFMQMLHGVCALAIPLAGRQPSIAVPLIVIAQTIWGLTGVIYSVNVVSLRQTMTPNQFQGRVIASLRFMTAGISPIGFLIGGALGERIGLQPTLVIAGIGLLLSNSWLLFSPLLRLREPPAPEIMASMQGIIP